MWLSTAAAVDPHVHVDAEIRRDVPSKWETQMPPPPPGKGFLGNVTNKEFDGAAKAKVERWQWLIKLLGFQNEEDRWFRASHRVLQSCVNQSAIRDAYLALDLAPTFHAQHAMLLVHVWLVHRRLNREGEPGKILQEQVFDRFWDETQLRIRFMGVPETSVSKQLRQVQQRSFMTLVAYDRALEEGHNAFPRAITEHVVTDKDTNGERTATLLATYMRRQMKMLEKLESKFLMEGSIPWGPSITPSSPQLSTAAKSADEDDEEDTIVGEQIGNWRSALDNAGKLYYWNLTTRVSTWERPTGEALMHGASTNANNTQ